MMGGHAMSVVDGELKVHGLDALRHRRLDHAGGQLNQHQHADYHDRREGCREDQGLGTTKVGRLRCPLARTRGCLLTVKRREA
jgi:hypothetical protein